MAPGMALRKTVGGDFMSNAKPTPGRWEAVGNLVRSPMHQPEGLPRGVQIAECRDGYFLPHTDEAKANANLIAEAGTVYHETGKTPARLAEINEELLEALKSALLNDGGYHAWKDQAAAAIANAEVN